MIQQILPEQIETIPEKIATSVLKTLASPIGVGAPEAVAFCNELSHLLMTDPRARAFPGLQALGFWLRPGSIINILQNYMPTPEQTIRVPRGVVFQIPPSNVDVLFGYTSALSLLSGNVTIVRLPERVDPEQVLLLEMMSAALSKSHDAIRERMIVIRYERNDVITSALSALCDARMVWGGDQTITHIRSIPLPPLAHEISFADRFSAAAINASHYENLGAPQREQLTHAIYNDVYLFDQMACSSPRLLIWVGDEQTTKLASADFYTRLSAYALERFGNPGAGENMAKMNAHFLALHDLKLASSMTYNAALTVLTLAGWEGVSAYKSLNFGYGLLLATRLERLRDLAIYAEKKDQTLAVWGFGPDEVRSFVMQCNGRGFDRVVPLGQALSFDPIWDGNNMFEILTRLVQVTA